MVLGPKIVVLLYNFDATYSSFIYIQTLNMILYICCFLVAHNYRYIPTIKSSALKILLPCFLVTRNTYKFYGCLLYFSFFKWMEHYYLSKRKEKKKFFGLLASTNIFFSLVVLSMYMILIKMENDMLIKIQTYVLHFFWVFLLKYLTFFCK